MGKSAKKKGKTAAGPSSTTTVAPTLSSPADATDSTGVPDVEGTSVTSVSNTPPGSPGPEGRRVEESELNEIEPVEPPLPPIAYPFVKHPLAAPRQRAEQEATAKRESYEEAAKFMAVREAAVSVQEEDEEWKSADESKNKSYADSIGGRMVEEDYEAKCKLVQEAQREVEEMKRLEMAVKVHAEEEASRRAAHELALAIAAEEERQEELAIKNAENMNEVERAREEREHSHAHSAHKQQITQKVDEQLVAQAPTPSENKTTAIIAAESAQRQEEARMQHAERQRQDAIRLEEQRRTNDEVRKEAELAARELDQQGLVKSERKARESDERARTAMLQQHSRNDIEAKSDFTLSPSLGGFISSQHVKCLTAWVNSVLPEDAAIRDLQELLTTPMVLTLVAERLAGQLVHGVVRAPTSPQQHQQNLALSLSFLSSIGCNKYCVEHQTLSLGGPAAVCDLLWEMAEHFVMSRAFSSLAREQDVQAYAEQGWMEGARVWVQQMTMIRVEDFSESFQDGRVLLAIMVAAWPGSHIDVAATVRDNAADEVLELALSIAKRRWSIPSLLSALLISDQGADAACVLLYLALLSQRLPRAADLPPALSMHGGSAQEELPSKSHRAPEIAPPGGVEAHTEQVWRAEQTGNGSSAQLVPQSSNGVGKGEMTGPAMQVMRADEADGNGSRGGAGNTAIAMQTQAHVAPPSEESVAVSASAALEVRRTVARAAATVEAASVAASWRELSEAPGVGGKTRGPTCAGCFKTMHRPRLLQCMHIFCLTCLEGMVEAEAGHMLVRCPECQLPTPIGRSEEGKSLELMNSDEGVLKVLALLSDQPGASGAAGEHVGRPSVCDNCLQVNAAVWCDACDAALCTQCSGRIHGFRSISAARDHNPTRLPAGVRARPRLPTCRTHPGEKLLFLSISRQQLICRECVLVGGHDKDRYVPVEEAGRQTRVDLLDMIEKVQAVAGQVDRAMHEAAARTPTVMDAYRARMQRLESRANELKAAMEDRKASALAEVAEERDRKTQRLLVQGVGIGRVAVALEHGALMGQLLKSHGNDLEILRASQSLERLLRAASAIAVDGTPVEGPALFSGQASETCHDWGRQGTANGNVKVSAARTLLLKA